jgi:hypothetical protein
MWFDPNDPRSTYGDIRSCNITVTDNSKGNLSGKRHITISPDVILDMAALPYPDESYMLVVLDPPHLVHAGRTSWLAAKYGTLCQDWRDDMRKWIDECYRVLAVGGTMIIKWSEVQIPIRDILALTTHKPLFGHRSGKRSGTHWLVFIKDDQLTNN